ncbi:MAG: hypothetical protein EP319_14600 [Deltaproteobacteria bacterium]|nr:MAG: hypothetical protein EP319_14600 [Deltaproteobacteria bacterium]
MNSEVRQHSLFDLKDTLDIAGKILSMVFMITFVKYEGISPFIRSTGVLTILCAYFMKDLFKQPLYWFSLSALMAIHVAQNYFASANHLFVMVYFSAIFGLTHYQLENKEKFLITSFKWMFTVFMGLATLHKGASLFYWQGGLFHDYILRGGILKFVFKAFIPNFSEITASNSQLLNDFLANAENFGKTLKLNNPISSLGLIGSLLAGSVVIVEGILVGLMLTKKFEKTKHALLLVFVISTFFFRLENIFLSLVSMTGFILCPKEQLTVRRSYLVLIAYLLSTSALHMRPGFYY